MEDLFLPTYLLFGIKHQTLMKSVALCGSLLLWRIKKAYFELWGSWG